MRFNIPVENKTSSGIYSIVNTVNKKVYIGSAATFWGRYHNHKTYLSKNNHRNPRLQKSVNKYGIDNFEFNLLELCDKSVLLIREQLWMDKYNVSVEGFNINPVAGSGLGRKATPEERLKRSIAKIGSKLSPESIAKRTATRMEIGNYSHSPETRKKVVRSTNRQTDIPRNH
jgi:group I intron endonuclease